MCAKCWDEHHRTRTMSYFVNLTSTTFYILLGLPILPASCQAGTTFCRTLLCPVLAVERASAERDQSELRWEEKLPECNGTSEKVSAKAGARLQKVFLSFSFLNVPPQSCFLVPINSSNASLCTDHITLQQCFRARCAAGRVVGDYCHGIV